MYEIQHSTSSETGITTTFIITKDFTDNAAVDFEPFCNYYTDHNEPKNGISKELLGAIVTVVMQSELR